MPRLHQRLDRLISTARKAGLPTAQAAAEPPFGFAARVAATGISQPTTSAPSIDILERISWVGASVATLIFLTTFAYRANLPDEDALYLILDTPAIGLEVIDDAQTVTNR